MCHYLNTLGVKSTNDIDDPDVTHVMHYNYANRVDECPAELLQKAQELGVPVINEHLLNIKKDYIDDLFTDVFGYSIRLDPTKHRGFCFKRSSQNAIHMGKFVECPISSSEIDREPRYSTKGEPHYRMYVKIIDTRISHDKIRDFRIAVMGGKVVQLYEKHMDSTCIFHPKKDKYYAAWAYDNMDKYFSHEEQGLIQEFITRSGASFTEIDILRNNNDGRMYICDSNPAPGGGLFNRLPNGDAVIKKLANIFKETYLQV